MIEPTTIPIAIGTKHHSDRYRDQGQHLDLMNPVNQPRRKGLVKSISHRIMLPVSEGVFIVPLADILMCSASGNYSTVTLKSGKEITVSKTLKRFVQALPQSQFIRVHQSYLVNINSIRFVGKNLMQLDGETRIPVSRRMCQELAGRLENLSITL